MTITTTTRTTKKLYAWYVTTSHGNHAIKMYRLGQLYPTPVTRNTKDIQEYDMVIQLGDKL